MNCLTQEGLWEYHTFALVAAVMVSTNSFDETSTVGIREHTGCQYPWHQPSSRYGIGEWKSAAALVPFLDIWSPKLSLWIWSMAGVVKNPPANVGNARDMGLIPGLGRSPGGGHGNPLQYPCLGNPTDRGVWWATVRRIAKSRTWLKWLNMHALEKNGRSWLIAQRTHHGTHLRCSLRKSQQT